MKPRALTLALALVIAFWPGISFAHDERSSTVSLDLHELNVTGDILLPMDRLEGATLLPLFETPQEEVIPLYGQQILAYVAERFSVVGPTGQGWRIDMGQLALDASGTGNKLSLPITLTPPNGEPVTDFTLRYDAILEKTEDHEIIILTSSNGSERQVLGILKTGTTEMRISAPTAGEATPSGDDGFGAMVVHGYKHVAAGADHLLFLLVLLIPAPLMAVVGRWRPADKGWRTLWRLLQVVTAFTLGHSVTLVASAFGWVSIPTRPVEIMIAISVGVGAIHALRPLVKNGEPKIAGAFGLVHGLAFAGILDALGVQGTPAVSSLLGFNIGIELAGLTAVALVFPSLYVLSRTSVYPKVRIAGALMALIAATAWVIDRSGIASNPFQPVEDFLVAKPLIVAAVLAVAAAVAFRWMRPPDDALLSEETATPAV